MGCAGELLFHIDGTERTAGAGDTLAVRRGVPHAFTVTSEIARFLVVNTPGTHDRYFRDGGDPAASLGFDTAPPPNYGKIEASNRKPRSRTLTTTSAAPTTNAEIAKPSDVP